MARLWALLLASAGAAYTEEFLQAFNNLGLVQWNGIEMDIAWGHVTMQYGLHRPSLTGPIFVYRASTSLEVVLPPRVQVLTHANSLPEQVLSAIAAHFPDLRDTWTTDAWHLAAIDSTRGHSRDRSLMHLSYVLIQSDDYWTFNQRPHGLVELLLGDRDFSFPTILPQMINLSIVQAVLAPLIPGALPCLAMDAWYNGGALGAQLLNCLFDGFFVQVTVTCVRTLMDNLIVAAPTVSPRMHLDPLVLPDPQLLHVTAFVPGGGTLISSRTLVVIQRRDRVYTVLHSELRRRFPDMLHVGFEVLTAHPSSKWLDPCYCPQKEKLVIVYTDELLRRDASVLLRLSLPPFEEEGAIYLPRRLVLKTLVRVTMSSSANSSLEVASAARPDGEVAIHSAQILEDSQPVSPPPSKRRRWRWPMILHLPSGQRFSVVTNW